MTRDHRNLALMVGLPLMLLVIFGYAARFDVSSVDTVVVGAESPGVVGELPDIFDIEDVVEDGGRADAEAALVDGQASVAFLAEGGQLSMLVDGTELFSSQSALRRLPPGAQPEILFNPDLDTATVMVPSLIGLILLFVGTIVTSLGVVREREQGTMEQLAVMPLRPLDITVGKVAPYFLVGVADMVVVTLAGLWIFDVPFEGSVVVFAVFGFVFLLVVLGLGVAISTVSQSQGEAVQLAILALLPQIMLSGMIFPLQSMAAGVRWIGYLLPLTWFIEATRAILLKGSGLGDLLIPLAVLTFMAAAVFGVAMVRFRSELAPKQATGAAS